VVVVPTLTVLTIVETVLVVEAVEALVSVVVPIPAKLSLFVHSTYLNTEH
jgi:hypothetical protein